MTVHALSDRTSARRRRWWAEVGWKYPVAEFGKFGPPPVSM